MQKLTIDDIKDQRAYERGRDEFRRHIIEMKKRRRVPLGEVMTAVFENTETMRWQVQEMVRVERMLRDEQVENEIATYNELIPGPGELSATLLIELTSEEQLREWLPRLVGVQRSVQLVVGDLPPVVGEPRDEERLTREEVTAAVHFLRFRLPQEHRAAFAHSVVRLVVDHAQYHADVILNDDQRAELAGDLAD
jgi:hypothetical protein